MKPEYSAAREQRLSSSPRKHICFAFHCCSDKSKNYEVNMYIVGRDSSSSSSSPGDEYLHMAPNIKFKGSKTDSPDPAFCSLNSTLYMFEGDVLGKPGVGTRAGRSAHKFVLTPEVVAGLQKHELVADNLDTIKPMSEPKICPEAVPTPDGNHILVFSSQFYGQDSFELYSVGCDSWTILPRLPLQIPRDEFHAVGAYGFQNESHFVVQIDDELAFVLHIPSMSWRRDSGWAPVPWPRYFLGSDRFALTPYGAYDVRDGLGPFLFDHPISKFPTHLRNNLIALSDDYDYEDGVCGIAVVQAQRPSSYAPRQCYDNLLVILDICQIDMVQFRRDFEKFDTDMDKYRQEVQESLPNKPSFTITVSKSPELFKKSFQEHKRDLDNFMEQCMRTYEEKCRPVMPLLSTTVSKTLKLLVGFDFANYSYAKMHVFSI